MVIPKTSVSLLNAVAASNESLRWLDFYKRYQPVLAVFLQRRFPSLEAEDVIQETMIAFMKQLPNYKYDPKLKGHFHNYLLGIAKFKALIALRRRICEGGKSDKYEKEIANSSDSRSLDPGDMLDQQDQGMDQSKEELHKSIAALAIQKFLADDSVTMRNREVFRRTALNHESPETVAEAYGITRNYVDQIKARAIKRIREIGDAMKSESRA